MQSPRHPAWVIWLACCFACQTTGGLPSATSPATPPKLDQEILSMSGQVSEQRLMETVGKLVDFGTRNSCSVALGTGKGIGSARDFLQRQFGEITGLKVVLDPYPQPKCKDPTTSSNVLAYAIGARDPDRLIIVGGHYDSIAFSGSTPEIREAERGRLDLAAPGANDSGSQTALVLEAARVMAGRAYDATVVFIAFAGEEQGLTGSKAFAKNYRQYFPNGKIEAVLNCDIVGGDVSANDSARLRQFRLFAPGAPREVGKAPDGTPDSTSPSRMVMRFVRDWASQYVPSMTLLPRLREDRVGRGGDHESFVAEGYPGVRFIETEENVAHQHSSEDVVANMTPAYLSRMTQTVVASAAALARAPRSPEILGVTGRSGDSVTLTWKPVDQQRVDHVVVAVRSVNENFYGRRVAVDRGASSFQYRNPEFLGGIPAPFFISVAAVDSAGHESVFAYPEYRCDAASCSVPAAASDVTAVVKSGAPL